MAHHVYKTDALVVGARDVGETHRSVALLTEEVGLVHALARGSRKGESKFRSGVQDFSLSRVSLVRGKEVWRVIGALEHVNYYYACADSRAKRGALAYVVRLVRRLVHGEERNERLFRMVIQMLDALRALPDDKEITYRFERVTALQVLHELGYVEKEQWNAPLLERGIDLELLAQASPLVGQLDEVVRHALEESHL